MKIIFALIFMTVSYFIGNISPATLLARALGHDIKSEGSGNAGTTNVLRVLGPKAAIITLLVDVAKGFFATWLGYTIAKMLAEKMFDPIFTDPSKFALAISAWCGLAVFIGHIWPIIFKFKGGKGVATALGVLLATDYRVALLCLGVFVIIVVATRMVSLGSICAAIAFPFIYLYFQLSKVRGLTFMMFITVYGPIIVPLIIMVIVLIVKHRENIKRIIAGEENKLSLKKEISNIK